MPDGVNFKLHGCLETRLADGSVEITPSGFNTDLASIPPLGFLGGSLMLIAHLFPSLSPGVWIGFFICVMSIWLKSYGFYTWAAVFHDWIFKTHRFSFSRCNWYLLRLMLVSRSGGRVRRKLELLLIFLIWFNVQFTGIGWWIYWSKKR